MRFKHVVITLVVLSAAAGIAVPLSGRDWGSVIANTKAAVMPRLQAAFGAAPATGKGGPGVAAPQAPPPVVIVSQPVERPIVEWDEYTGRFEAVEAVEIRARVNGYLTEVHFKDGQHVEKGDLLYVIDQRPFERALELAKAELDSAKVRVDNASLDVERGRPLLERKVISEKLFDDRSNVMREAQSAVKVAEARVKAAELELSFTKIMAPVSGRISRSIVTPGNFVSGGGSTGTTTLTSIVSQNPIYVYFDVSEQNAIKYRRLSESGSEGGVAPGGAVGLALPDETGFPHAGKLDFLDNRFDGGTGTLSARAVYENAAGLFTPGMFARIRLQGSAEYRANLLPDEAIGTDQASRFVWVIEEDQMPARRTVKLGPIADGLRVVREGISASDWVVVKGLQRVRPGQKVMVKREPIAVSQAGGARDGADAKLGNP